MNLPEPRLPTILVVDDEAPIREFLTLLFRQTIPSARVLGAADGASGLSLLDSNAVDLVISDYRMPGMDGVAFLGLAAKAQPGVPRILLTGFADVEVAVRAINEGKVTAFYNKPVPAAIIAKAALTLLTARQEKLSRERAFARAFQSIDHAPALAPRVDLGEGVP